MRNTDGAESFIDDLGRTLSKANSFIDDLGPAESFTM